MCREFVVAGRVQGVYFRASTAKVAHGLGLVGEARNLDDGRVRVIACGGTDELAQLETWLHSGPMLANVESVTAANAACPGGDQIAAEFTTA